MVNSHNLTSTGDLQQDLPPRKKQKVSQFKSYVTMFYLPNSSSVSINSNASIDGDLPGDPPLPSTDTAFEHPRKLPRNYAQLQLAFANCNPPEQPDSLEKRDPTQQHFSKETACGITEYVRADIPGFEGVNKTRYVYPYR